MIKYLNLGNEVDTVDSLNKIKSKKLNNYDIRISNSHITDLNNVIGRKVFKNDLVYISFETLWEIMQPVGSKGKHHHPHGLSPNDIYNALSTIKNSEDITISYDNRYIIVTLATISDDANLVVIVSPDCSLLSNAKSKITKIITIYPKNNNKK